MCTLSFEDMGIDASRLNVKLQKVEGTDNYTVTVPSKPTVTFIGPTAHQDAKKYQLSEQWSLL